MGRGGEDRAGNVCPDDYTVKRSNDHFVTWQVLSHVIDRNCS